MVLAGEPIERAKEQVADIARTCAAIQHDYNPGSSPAVFLGTAALFSAVSAGAFGVAARMDGQTTIQRLKKLSAGSIGAGAGALASLDLVTYVGLNLDKGAPSSIEADYAAVAPGPTKLERMMDGDLFQQHILDSKILPVRMAGLALVIGNAFSKGRHDLYHGA